MDVDVITVMQALHEEITGRYETAHRLTNGHKIGSGTVQGCANGGVRAKIGAIAPMQKAVTQLCRGFKVGERPGGSVPQVYFADEGAFLTNSLADLHAIHDINWIMARMMGIEIKVKGLDKTAYSAVQYKDGVAHNPEGIHITLPDGINVP